MDAIVGTGSWTINPDPRPDPFLGFPSLGYPARQGVPLSLPPPFPFRFGGSGAVATVRKPLGCWVQPFHPRSLSIHPLFRLALLPCPDPFPGFYPSAILHVRGSRSRSRPISVLFWGVRSRCNREKASRLLVRPSHPRSLPIHPLFHLALTPPS